MDGATPLDLALGHGKVVLERSAVVHQPLDFDRRALLRLDLDLDVFDGVVGEHVEGHGLVAGYLRRLEEDLDVTLRQRKQAHTHTHTPTATDGINRAHAVNKTGMGNSRRSTDSKKNSVRDCAQNIT